MRISTTTTINEDNVTALHSLLKANVVRITDEQMNLHRRDGVNELVMTSVVTNLKESFLNKIRDVFGDSSTLNSNFIDTVADIIDYVGALDATWDESLNNGEYSELELDSDSPELEPFYSIQEEFERIFIFD